MSRPRLAKLLWTVSGNGETFRRYAYDQIGVGAETEPGGALVGTCDAGKVSLLVEHVRNDLKVQVRRPAAIDAHIADAGERRSPCDGLALVQSIERSGAQVAVEGEEGDFPVVLPGNAMLQDD